jgi:hypothetical protein
MYSRYVSAAPVGEAATAILPEIRELPGQCIQVLTDLAYDPQRLAWDGSQDEAMHGDNVIRDNARALLRLRER